MAVFSWRPVHSLVAVGMMLSVFACGAGRSQPRSAPAERSLVSLNDDGGSVCTLNESVVSRSGDYRTNVDLSASIALPGETGVDVVMTPQGAIAAVNTPSGATLHWVDPATGTIEQTVDVPAAIADIAFDGESTLAVASGNQLLQLDTTSGEVLSQNRLPNISRVAVAPDGHVAAIANKTVYLYDAEGSEVFSKLRNYRSVTDVEVLSCGGGRQFVYVTSFRNATFTDINDRTNPVQISKLEALDFSGEVQWSLFGDSTDTIKQNVADTRLYRTTLGRDGYLYILGESAGTATIFRWRGQPMTEDEQFGRTRPFLTRIDEYSSLHNSGAAHLTYYARVHPTDGQLVTAQMSFPRLPNTKANVMRVGDIAGNANGTVYFGGAAGATIANRDELTLNGVPVGDYEGRDRAWMSVAPDFETRNFWTVLADEGGEGIVQGVDAGYGYSAALSNAESGSVPVTTGDSTGKVFLSFTAD
ncbi:MAG: hypothetical protein AAFP07_17525 [Cyanobacteria bacterium J06606_4]